MIFKPNKTILEMKSYFQDISQKVELNLDERFKKIVNQPVYEAYLTQVKFLRKPYEKLSNHLDELDRQKYNHLYGLLLAAIGFFFLYDLVSGQKILPNFDTFWYWFLTIYLIIAGFGSMPLVYKGFQKTQTEIYQRYREISNELHLYEAKCKDALQPFFDNYSLNNIYQLIGNIDYDVFIYPIVDLYKLAALKDLVGYKDQVGSTETVKKLFFGLYKYNPFMVYDIQSYKITDQVFSNVKNVSWDTKDVKETSDAIITTKTTHSQTLRASIVTKGPTYYNRRVFEFWNTSMPNLNFELTSSLYHFDKRLLRKIKSDIIHFRLTKQSVHKVFDKVFYLNCDQMDLFNQVFTEDVKRAYIAYALYNYQCLGSKFIIKKTGYKYLLELTTLEYFNKPNEDTFKKLYNLDFGIYKKDYLNTFGSFIEFIFNLMKPFNALPILNDSTFKNYKADYLPNQYIASLQHESLIHEMKISDLISYDVDKVTYKTRMIGVFDYLDYVEVQASYWLYNMKSDKVLVKDDNQMSHSIRVDYKEFYEHSETFNMHFKPCPQYFKYDHFKKLLDAHPQKDKIKDYLAVSKFVDNVFVFKYPTTILKADNDLLNTLIFYNE